MPDTSFTELFALVKSGDADAAQELVRQYEPEIRRVVRVRLTDSKLRRLVDSIDICQSVLAGFFVRTAAGQYDLETPEELLRLLVTMAKNRVVDMARYSQAARRDGRRNVGMEDHNGDALELKAVGPGPESVIVNRELVDAVRSRLSGEELEIMQLRSDGRNWDEIAATLGEKSNAVRMRLSRALDRVSGELGLETSGV